MNADKALRKIRLNPIKAFLSELMSGAEREWASSVIELDWESR